jgi:hypothetical protein
MGLLEECPPLSTLNLYLERTCQSSDGNKNMRKLGILDLNITSKSIDNIIWDPHLSKGFYLFNDIVAWEVALNIVETS